MTQAAKRNSPQGGSDPLETEIRALLARMTLAEKIGQMQQVDVSGDLLSDQLKQDIRDGKIGAIINQSGREVGNELQRIACEESRLGIPLLAGRDVIHGYKTILPIPLGQGATWNRHLVKEGARIAALEAHSGGINWTFAPMIDVSRDPRWGRIAESFGEDPYLTGELGAAMTEGFQGKDLSAPGTLAACAKHFAGYGASESGRDYNTTNIPENELRNIYLPPFRKAVDSGIATFMSSFSDIDGVPATANKVLMRDILRQEWGFDGLVVSDWDSVRQLSVHGLSANDREAAFEAASAGIDMEMAGGAYADHLQDLIADGLIEETLIDEMVINILRIKARLGLFERPYVAEEDCEPIATPHALATAKATALESVVLLKNEAGALPLRKDALKRLAVIGPMADAPYEQLGTWVFDGDSAFSVTPLQAIQEVAARHFDVTFTPALSSTRCRKQTHFEAALEATRAADAAVLFLGEEAILSGEAHCRADIGLPGAQADLIKTLKQAGKPIIAVILAGRPLTLGDILEDVDALLFAWHPGTMAGPALSDLLFGLVSPSGKLPVSFPKMVGQIPIYYNHKNTGRPPTPNSVVHIDDIEVGATQTSLGMTAFHIDAGYKPLFPFGFGLSYTQFSYDDLTLSTQTLRSGQTLDITARITNIGEMKGAEVVQLYVRDLAASITRPVRELKAFQKVTLMPGQSTEVTFALTPGDLSFFRRDKSWGPESGEFHLWVAGASEGGMQSAFRLDLKPREI